MNKQYKSHQLIVLINQAQRYSIDQFMHQTAIELGLIKSPHELAVTLGSKAFAQTLLLKLQYADQARRNVYISFLNEEIATGKARVAGKKTNSATQVNVEVHAYLTALVTKENDPKKVVALEQLIRYIVPDRNTGSTLSRMTLDNLIEDYLLQAVYAAPEEMVYMALRFSAAINSSAR
jgi:hypothetical protein